MSETLAPVHDSLDELRGLIGSTADPAERLGLEAFIDCVAPHLMEGATMTYLGKIAASVQVDMTASPATTADGLEALREHFDVVIESAN